MKTSSKPKKTQKRVNIGLEEKVHTKAKVISVLKHETLNKYFEQIIASAVKRDLKSITGGKR